MTPPLPLEDEKKIRIWASGPTSGQGQIVLNIDDSPASGLLDDFTAALSQMVPQLTIRRNPDDAFCRPALIIGPRANIAFQAVPSGLELDPFLEALAVGDDDSNLLGTGTMALLAQLTQPMDLVLYIGAHCPHCPQTVRRLWPLAAAGADIRLTIVDAALFEERARAHGVRSVPLLIMDGQFRWSGLPDLDEVLTIGLKRNSRLISADALRRIIEAGDAGHAAKMMIDSNNIFPALIPLLTHEKWSVRLGAMVTVEYLADEAPALADRLIGPLWKDFRRYAAPIQGDVTHVLGSIGSDKAQSVLKKIAAGPFEEEVVGAAKEALN